MTHFVFLFLLFFEKKKTKTNTLQMEKKLWPWKLWKACDQR